MRKILHVSDLHFGKTDPLVIGKLQESIIAASPDIIVVSGDLTQRAEIEQFKDAQAFLGAVKNSGAHVFVIPGNHDIRPVYAPIKRALSPYDRYKQHISEEIAPRYADDEVAIASIDTVRRGKISNGKIGKQQVEELRSWFSTLHPETTRIVVTHHPLDLPKDLLRPLVRRAKHAVYGLASSRIDLYLAGHYHRSSVTSTDSRYRDLSRPSLAVQAGTVSMRGRGEAQSFNILTVQSHDMHVDTHLFSAETETFEMSGRKRFIREEDVWRSDS
ncbi:metallophosphoesterase [Candidatus Kaiserbacteria bacterium]|nr:metallophosphoesterase [Candidatus Kaiserbacteria bacterium]